MTNKLPQLDPEADWARKAAAVRRVGDRQCACGERRPKALIPKSDPIRCHECQRKKEGKTHMDNHHPAAKANNPTTTPVPVNDHRAELSPAQDDWPKETLENPDGSPLLAFAGCVRGYADTAVYLIEKLLLPFATMLEVLDRYLVNTVGEKWWINTELEKFSPKYKEPVS
jgi:hypothetical protein